MEMHTRTRSALNLCRENLEDALVELEDAREQLHAKEKLLKVLQKDETYGVRRLIADEGGKCAALAQNASLVTLFNAAVGKYRRTAKKTRKKHTALVEAGNEARVKSEAKVEELRSDVSELREKLHIARSELGRERNLSKKAADDIGRLRNTIACLSIDADNGKAASLQMATLQKQLQKTNDLRQRAVDNQKLLRKENQQFSVLLRDLQSKVPTCAICFDTDKPVDVFLPCFHASVCTSCSSFVEACPICRCDIESRHKISFCGI